MNSRILKLAFLDVKMMMKSIIFLCGIGAAVIFLVLWMIRKPLSFNTDSYMYMFFEVMKYIFIINGVMILGKDYKNGTYKYMFTGALTRSQVIFEKILALIMFGVACGMIQTLARVVISIRLNQGINWSDLFAVNILFELWLYIVFALLTGAFSIMMLIITKKVKITFVSTLTLFGIIQYFSGLFIVLATRSVALPTWAKSIFYTPTYIIWKWMQQSTPTMGQNILMLIYITLMFAVAIIVINKKDMNIEQ